MFKETFNHTLDDNNRVAIPSKWRKNISPAGTPTLIVTRGLEPHLLMYTQDYWQENIEARAASFQINNRKAMGFVRFMISGASECPLDRSGRIILPKNLIDYAKIQKEIVLNGVGFFMEIWAQEEWDRYMQDNIESAKEFAETFFSIPAGKGEEK